MRSCFSPAMDPITSQMSLKDHTPPHLCKHICLPKRANRRCLLETQTGKSSDLAKDFLQRQYIAAIGGSLQKPLCPYPTDDL